jgi:hypothetical protein
MLFLPTQTSTDPSNPNPDPLTLQISHDLTQKFKNKSSIGSINIS